MRIAKYVVIGLGGLIIGIVVAGAVIYYVFTPTTTTVTTGSIDFLHIGQTKPEVLDAARQAGIRCLEPEVYKRIYVTRADKLPLLYNVQGLVYRTRGSDELYIFFKHRQVSFLSYVPLPQYQKKYGSAFWIGQSKQAAFKGLDKLFRKYPQSYAFNTIPNLRWIDLDEGPLSAKDRHFLMSHNGWLFDGPPHEYSEFHLYFKDGRLEKVFRLTTPKIFQGKMSKKMKERAKKMEKRYRAQGGGCNGIKIPSE